MREAPRRGSRGSSVIGTDTFETTLVRSPTRHSRPVEETDSWLRSLLDQVPITRVYDATPLDSLGIPVWGAVTPLARDLTVHAGKGLTAVAARVSACMEAIERICAEEVDQQRVRRAAHTELAADGRVDLIDPELYDFPFQTRFRADREISWVDGYDLITGRPTWVPLDLAISPAREGVCLGVETNGLAAGNSYTEAAVHGLLEVIERDALAHHRFATLFASPSDRPSLRLVDIASLPPLLEHLVAQLSASGVKVSIQDLKHDLEVPVFRVTISDRWFPGREGKTSRFDGLGCDLDPTVALTRAICEAAQSHTTFAVGARDTFEDGRRGVPRTPATLVQRLLAPSSIVPFSEEIPGELTGDLLDHLRTLLRRLEPSGLRHCVVVDLTQPRLGVPVVRVLVPGAAGPYGETTRRPALRLLRSLV